MKRLLPLLLTLILLSGAGQTRAQGETRVRVSPAAVTLAPGQSTMVAVEVVAVSDMRGFEVTIEFDPSRVYIPPESLAIGSFLAPGIPSPANRVDNNAGVLICGKVIIGDEVSSGSGTLFTFTVQAKQTPAETPLAIVESELVHADYFEIEHEFEHGLVRILGLQDDSYETGVNQTLVVASPGVLGNDIFPEGAAVWAELVDDLPAGEGVLDLSADGGFTYIPPTDWTGTTGFTYRACYAGQCTSSARVTITVSPFFIPVALDDSYETAVNQTLKAAPPGVLGNDIFPEGAAVWAELVDDLPAGEGSLDLSADGGFTYIPPTDWAGTTGFTYRACCEFDCSQPAGVSINIDMEEQQGTKVFLPLILR